MTKPPRTVRLLHTSDLHVGATDRHAWGLSGLRAALDVALKADVDVLLVAGDLFDHARVDADLVVEVCRELRRFPREIVLAPGNHDVTAPGAVWERVDLRRAGEHVRLATDPDGEHLLVADGSVAVWARGFLVHEPTFRPLDGYQRYPRAAWQVALAHGHFQAHGREDGRSSPIPAEHLASLRSDYVALGHWHHYREVTQGATVAAYSGSPAEPGRRDSSVNVVQLTEGRPAHIQRVITEAY